MPTVELLVTVKQGGVYHPPGSTLEVSDDDAEALHGRAKLLSGVALPLPTDNDVPADDAATHDVLLHEPTEGDTGSRLEEIASAIDLLTPENFNQNGRPKVGALADILGFKPSADEIDAALALRDEQTGQA